MSQDGRERVNPFSPGGSSGSQLQQQDGNPPSNRGHTKELSADYRSMADSYMEISKQIDTSSTVNNNTAEEAGATGAESTRTQDSRRPDSLGGEKVFPYNMEGTVSREGDMTHFVTDGIEDKIKLSSPVNKKDIWGLYTRHNNTPPSSSNLAANRSFFGTHPHQQQPQIDSNVLNDIEIEAQYLAASLDNLTENLCNLLHSISSITADNVEIHKNAVNKLTDSMDANIKNMYTIMAKTEEISKSMKPTEQLANRIREIKRLVDILDSNM